MITVLIVVGVCWFLAALLFVLALGISARHRRPAPKQKLNPTAITETKTGEPATNERHRWFWSKAKRAVVAG